MKLVRYGKAGQEKPGLIDEDGNIRDLSRKIGDVSGEFLSDKTLKMLRELDVKRLKKVEGRQRLGPCVGSIGKYMCIGLNYSDHAAEQGLPIDGRPGVAFSIDVGRFEATLETATRTGLIVSEVLTNAFQHAFVGLDAGTVRMEVIALTEGGFRVVVSDDGIGSVIIVGAGAAGD